MIFSAVALVAFSFAGMANEVEEKIETKEALDCNAYRVIIYLGYLSSGFSQEAASAASYEFYFGCLSNTVPKELTLE